MNGWTNRTTLTRHRTYFHRRTPTDLSQWTPVIYIKANSSTLSADDNTYKSLYSACAAPSKFYGLPKIHKQGTLVGPWDPAGVQLHMGQIWSWPTSLGTQYFVDHINSIRLEEGECILFYDVQALFTSVSVNPTISIIKQKLQKDPQLHSRTFMPIQHITTLLEFGLKYTYFLFQGKH